MTLTEGNAPGWGRFGLKPDSNFCWRKGRGLRRFLPAGQNRKSTAGHCWSPLHLRKRHLRSYPRTDLLVYHSRVLGRYEDEHLQMSGVLFKQRLSGNLAAGVLTQWGNQRGVQGFVAVRIPLRGDEGGHTEEENGGKQSALNLHLGFFWAKWKGEWEGEEFVPYAGLSWQPADGWLVTAELRARQKNFLKQAWMFAVHRQLSQRWLLTFGIAQSGLSDRPYISIGLGTGVGIVR